MEWITEPPTSANCSGRDAQGAVLTFAPVLDQYLKAHLFGDIFGRDNLDWKTRELATIASLAADGRRGERTENPHRPR